MNGWTEIVQQVLLIVITTFVPILSGVLIAYLRKKGMLEALKEKRVLVKKGVEFAEQAYYDLRGDQQYEIALEWIAERFRDVGIKFDPEDVRGLIEAAVYEMKEPWFNEFEEVK